MKASMTDIDKTGEDQPQVPRRSKSPASDGRSQYSAGNRPTRKNRSGRSQSKSPVRRTRTTRQRSRSFSPFRLFGRSESSNTNDALHMVPEGFNESSSDSFLASKRDSKREQMIQAFANMESLQEPLAEPPTLNETAPALSLDTLDSSVCSASLVSMSSDKDIFSSFASNQSTTGSSATQSADLVPDEDENDETSQTTTSQAKATHQETETDASGTSKRSSLEKLGELPEYYPGSNRPKRNSTSRHSTASSTVGSANSRLSFTSHNSSAGSMPSLSSIVERDLASVISDQSSIFANDSISSNSLSTAMSAAARRRLAKGSSASRTAPYSESRRGRSSSLTDPHLEGRTVDILPGPAYVAQTKEAKSRWEMTSPGSTTVRPPVSGATRVAAALSHAQKQLLPTNRPTRKTPPAPPRRRPAVDVRPIYVARRESDASTSSNVSAMMDSQVQLSEEASIPTMVRPLEKDKSLHSNLDAIPRAAIPTSGPFRDSFEHASPKDTFNASMNVLCSIDAVKPHLPF